MSVCIYTFSMIVKCICGKYENDAMENAFLTFSSNDEMRMNFLAFFTQKVSIDLLFFTVTVYAFICTKIYKCISISSKLYFILYYIYTEFIWSSSSSSSSPNLFGSLPKSLCQMNVYHGRNDFYHITTHSSMCYVCFGCVGVCVRVCVRACNSVTHK